MQVRLHSLLIYYTDALDACNKVRESAVTEVSRGMYVAINNYTRYRSIRRYVTVLTKLITRNVSFK